MTGPIHLAKPKPGIREPGDYPKLACGADPTDAQWDTCEDRVTCADCKDDESEDSE